MALTAAAQAIAAANPIRARLNLLEPMDGAAGADLSPRRRRVNLQEHSRRGTTVGEQDQSTESPQAPSETPPPEPPPAVRPLATTFEKKSEDRPGETRGGRSGS